MRFNKIEKFPSFDEFMKRLNGTWQLYKIEEKGRERRVSAQLENVELADRLEGLMADADGRRLMAGAAQRVIRENSGALQQVLALVEKELESLER